MLELVSVPDIIVLDVNMSLKSGKECLRAIRANREYNKVPVVMLSTSRHERDISYCLANGANKYIEKSPTYFELKKQLNISV